MPVPRKNPNKNHHLNNIKSLKSVFREKNTLMPYKHEEMNKSPFEALDEETKVKFDLNRLSPRQR